MVGTSTSSHLPFNLGLVLCFFLFLQLYVVSQYKILVSLLGKFLSLIY